MPEGDLVVADTSPLLNLALIERLDLLREQFATVTAPDQVWRELAAGEDGVPALRTLREDGTLEIVSIDEGPLLAELGRNSTLASQRPSRTRFGTTRTSC